MTLVHHVTWSAKLINNSRIKTYGNTSSLNEPLSTKFDGLKLDICYTIYTEQSLLIIIIITTTTTTTMI
jgi:hypothetical protein